MQLLRADRGGPRRTPRQLSALRNFLPVAGSEALAKAVGLAGALYVVRTVGPGTFGIAAVALAVVGYLDAAVLRGLDMEAVRRLSPWPSDAGSLVRRLFAVRFLAALALGGVVALVGWHTIRSSDARLALLAGCAIPLARSLQGKWIYQAWQNQVRVAWARCGTQLVALALVLTLLGPESSPAAIVLVVLAAEALLALWLVPPLWPLLVSAAGSSRSACLARISLAGVKLGVAFLLIQGLTTAGLLLTAVWTGAVGAAMYSAGYRFVEGAFLVSGALGAAFLPRVAAAARTTRLPDVLMSYWRLVALAAVPLGIFGALFAEHLVLALFGAEYTGAVLPLRLLLVAAAFDFANVVFLYSLGMVGRDRRFLAILGGGFALNLAASAVAIPRWGPAGAAGAMVASQAAIACAAAASLRRELPPRRALSALELPLQLTLGAVAAVVVVASLGLPSAAVVVAAAVALTTLALWKRTALRSVVGGANAV